MKEFILPCRDLVVHPGMTVPIYIDNSVSVSCIESAATATQKIVLVPQHVSTYPTNPDDIYEYGTIGDIVQVLRMPDGAVHAIIRTTDVVKLGNITVTDGIFSADTEIIPMLNDAEDERTLVMREKIFDTMQTMNAFRKLKIDKLRSVIQNYPMPAFIDSVMQSAEVDTDYAIRVLITPSWYEKMVMLKLTQLEEKSHLSTYPQ